jgi:Wiskott-Aldrich syndrome protein
MDEDDMDAPQISILREEESPSPVTSHPVRTSKFRVKLLVNESKSSIPHPNSSSRKQPSGLVGVEDDDDEEDQLIDDDEDARSNAPASGPSSGSRQPDTPPKRKVNPKKRVRRIEPKPDDEKRKAFLSTYGPYYSMLNAESVHVFLGDPALGEQIPTEGYGHTVDSPSARPPNKRKPAAKKSPSKPRGKAGKSVCCLLFKGQTSLICLPDL